LRGFQEIWRPVSVALGILSILRPAFADAPRTAPDARTIDRLQALFHGGRSARLSMTTGERILVSPAFSNQGVRVPGEPSLMPWSEIERIDARGGRPGRGALIGGIIGFGVGVGLGFAAALGDESGHGVREWIGITFVSTGGGAIGGAMLGALALPGGWSQVYPARETGSSWGLRKRK